MPRLPIKRARVITTVETRARMKAEAKFRASSPGIQDSLVRMLDRVDPIELIATIGLTLKVYEIIKSTPEFLAEAKMKIPMLVSPWLYLLYDRIWGAQKDLSASEAAELKRIREEPDVLLFFESFAIAYLLIKHSGSIISGLGNISVFIAGFFGLKAVP